VLSSPIPRRTIGPAALMGEGRRDESA
jgi:hypothetical protein